MKGNEKLIKKLDDLLADELTAINQYMVHSEMCDNWGYDLLHKTVEKRAIQEMKHAEKLIGRILFLEGQPTVSRLSPIRIGKDVPEQLQNDCAAEVSAIKDYNADIRLAAELGDNGTVELFKSLLKDEEDHLDWIETQLTQIEQLGLQNYLAEQTKS